MKRKLPPKSHHLLTSWYQYFASRVRTDRKRCGSVRCVQWNIIWLALTALVVALSPASVSAARPRPPKQKGVYDITISGYYRGAGTATASDTTVSMNARVKDDAGKSHQLVAGGLARDPDRH